MTNNTSAPPSSRALAGQRSRAERLMRRRQMLAIYFAGHAPGSPSEKRVRALRLINSVRYAQERVALHRLLAHLTVAAHDAPPLETDS
jgi:hypothetical protein